MDALAGLLLGAAVAAGLAPRALADFRANGWTRVNYRGVEVPFPAGALAVAAALAALAALALLDAAGLDVLPGTQVLALGLGVAFLGLLDDVLDAPARGMRGHARAVLSGGFSTGALKALGTLALALAVLAAESPDPGGYALGVALVVLCTNAFNLLDLRPGRAGKVFLLAGVAILAASRETAPLREVGVFAGPLAVLFAWDLRERAMLGDTGSNLMGAMTGLWIVLALDTTGQLAALGLLVALTLYGELRSISRAVERVPLLRRLDELGRPGATGHGRAAARPGP